MPFVLKRKLIGGGALLDQTSHWTTNFFSGRKLAAGTAEPITFAVDLDSEGRRMPTLFTTPAFIVRKSFLAVLEAAGIDNVEVLSASIRNQESGETIDDYVVLNVIGLVACADLAANPGVEFGPGLRVIDEPVVKGGVIRDLLMFRMAEDPIQILIADVVAQKIRESSLDDVFLAPVAVS